MGAVSSYMGIGMPKAQMTSWVMNVVYSNFVKEEITTPEGFHVAILDIFNCFNESLPGKHYDVPSRPEIEKCFQEWEKATNEEKKKVFMDFMTTSVRVNKLDHLTLVTGLMTPPVAMVAKRTGENIPQLMLLRAVPDVLFVPSATVFTLISVKLSRTMFSQKKVKPEQPTTA